MWRHNIQTRNEQCAIPLPMHRLFGIPVSAPVDLLSFFPIHPYPNSIWRLRPVLWLTLWCLLSYHDLSSLSILIYICVLERAWQLGRTARARSHTDHWRCAFSCKTTECCSEVFEHPNEPRFLETCAPMTSTIEKKCDNSCCLFLEKHMDTLWIVCSPGQTRQEHKTHFL